MKQTSKTMTVRLDEETYKEFMTVLDGIGLDFTSAVHSFVKQTVREQGLPFRPCIAAAQGKGQGCGSNEGRVK